MSGQKAGRFTNRLPSARAGRRQGVLTMDGFFKPDAASSLRV